MVKWVYECMDVGGSLKLDCIYNWKGGRGAGRKAGVQRGRQGGRKG